MSAADLGGEHYLDSDLAGIVRTMEKSVRSAQEAVRGALLDLVRVATEDADAVLTVPPETWQPEYLVKHRKVQRLTVGLDNARADLAAWARERDKRWAMRDTESSASRQHYIDTGNYLPAGETVDA